MERLHRVCRNVSNGKEWYLRSYRRRKSMSRIMVGIITIATFTSVAVLFAARPKRAANAKAPYATMAPLDQYLMSDRDAEIALARSAAPPSVAKDATVL